MILPDVNILVYAHREDAHQHEFYLAWLQDVVNGHEAFGLSDLVLSGFIRVVTHPKIFKTPSTVETAIEFANQLRQVPHCVPVNPGPRHWSIFAALCHEHNAKGNIVADTFFAALAIESGSEWITTDRDFSRFKGLKWRHPLKS